MKNVLILTYNDDPHAKVVCKRLEDIGAKYLNIVTENLPNSYKIYFDTKNLVYKIKTNTEEIVLNEQWTIWNRRIDDPIIEGEISEDIKKIAYGETSKTLEGLLMTHNGKVVSNPQAIFAANNKIEQLKFVKTGYNKIYIPDTIVTNDPSQVLDFYHQYSGNICFKLQKGVSIVKEGEDHFIYTNKIKPENLENLDLIKLNPSMFQEYIEKDYELRIIVIGDEVIATKINSQDAEISKIDFRRYDFANVGYEHIDLPPAVQNFCVDMVKHYGLEFGAFDFIYSKDGRHVFLELNPNGQWLWLELLSGYKISEVLADYLIK